MSDLIKIFNNMHAMHVAISHLIFVNNFNGLIIPISHIVNHYYTFVNNRIYNQDLFFQSISYSYLLYVHSIELWHFDIQLYNKVP